MGSIKALLILAGVGLAVLACAHLSSADNGQTFDHYLLHDACQSVINEQINWELYASIVYMNMAAYFDRPTVARSGYAKFFRDQSLEEYNHASKFVEYINKRNGTVSRISIDESPKSSWSSPVEALTDAIKLEKHVYSKIQHIHAVADQKCQDAHLTDFLEGYFFTEQVDSLKELQTMLSVISVDNDSAAYTITHMEDRRLSTGKNEL